MQIIRKYFRNYLDDLVISPGLLTLVIPFLLVFVYYFVPGVKLYFTLKYGFVIPFVAFLSFYILSYFPILLVGSHNGLERRKWMYSPAFYGTIGLAILWAALSRSFTFHLPLILELFPPENRLYAWKMSRISIRVVGYFIFPGIVYFIYRMSQPKLRLWGWQKPTGSLAPYFLFLLAVAPFVFAASFLPDFQRSYPRIRPEIAHYGDIASWKLILLYEMVYFFGFFGVETFFRGYFILAPMRWLGSAAILPTAALYMTIHIGKPFGETMSAFFGGILLGIITYYGKSIYGGIIAHLGLAAMMETAGYFQYFVRNHQ